MTMPRSCTLVYFLGIFLTFILSCTALPASAQTSTTSPTSIPSSESALLAPAVKPTLATIPIRNTPYTIQVNKVGDAFPEPQRLVGCLRAAMNQALVDSTGSRGLSPIDRGLWSFNLGQVMFIVKSTVAYPAKEETHPLCITNVVLSAVLSTLNRIYTTSEVVELEYSIVRAWSDAPADENVVGQGWVKILLNATT